MNTDLSDDFEYRLREGSLVAESDVKRDSSNYLKLYIGNRKRGALQRRSPTD